MDILEKADGCDGEKEPPAVSAMSVTPPAEPVRESDGCGEAPDDPENPIRNNRDWFEDVQNLLSVLSEEPKKPKAPVRPPVSDEPDIVEDLEEPLPKAEAPIEYVRADDLIEIVEDIELKPQA